MIRILYHETIPLQAATDSRDDRYGTMQPISHGTADSSSVDGNRFLTFRAKSRASVSEETEVKKVAKNIEKIAAGLGAKVVGQVPGTGGGAFGAAWLARIVENLQVRLVPGHGLRPGRPTEQAKGRLARSR